MGQKVEAVTKTLF